MQLYKNLTYESHLKKTVLFQIEEYGQKFYIILKGSVYVLVREKGLENSPRKQKHNSPILPSNASERPAFLLNLTKENPLAQKNSSFYEKVILLRRRY